MRFALTALAVVALAGCGGTGTEERGQGKPSAVVNESNYGDAHFLCGNGSPEKVARDWGASSTDPVAVATAYASGMYPAYRQAAFQGCLDALNGQ